MNKHYLAAIASLLILAIASASFLPVFAVTLRARVDPTLVVVTIPQDDQMRKTGIILLAATQASFETYLNDVPNYLYQKLISQFKLFVSFNGVPVTATIACQVIEKDKANPLKDQQFTAENLKTVPKDQSGLFVCKPRWAKPGVGVLDVYYIGSVSPQYIADYVVVVSAVTTIGRTAVYGAEIQDICVLGWSYEGWAYRFSKPDGTAHWVFADPLGSYYSCEEAALYQKHVSEGLPIPWT
jgi:hypothetical protein